MNGFSELDMVNYRHLIYSNIIQSVCQLIEGAKSLSIDVDKDAETDVEEFQRYQRIHPADNEFNDQITFIIKRLYKSAFINEVLPRQHEIILLDSAV